MSDTQAGAGGADTMAGAGAGAGGAYDGPWYGDPALGLDDEVKTLYGSRNTPTLADALKTGAHAFKIAQDRNAHPLPSDLARLTEWDGWGKLGVPEKLDDYKLARPDIVKDAKDYDTGFEARVRETAHKLRIPPMQTQGLYNDIASYFSEALKADETAKADAVKAEVDAVRKEWGAEFDARLESGKAAAKALGLDEAALGKVTEAFGSNATVLKLFGKLGELMKEDKLVMGEDGGAPGLNSEAAVREQLNKLQADRAFVASLSDVRNPLHAENTAKRERLLNRLAELRGAA
jgi:hypothetical protein